ncbi:hypothetical protein TH63_10260 [Rufibacter radiotolerans]|uniref:Outer membrane protein beta-barrel domain-containing protein n=1 Tax=Rufibacter radiotolerans TaxID=1379910 RepID=A0A0H4W679_9BACT|nr:hypothetical protein [Rufibacter radiotolerans]AKQ45941.1 hypothetical protein TH63_10260 [Rufibacter radiotolerans]
MKKLLLLPALLLVALTTSFAQTTTDSAATRVYRPVRFLVSGAFEFGGDKVAETLFTNGETQTTRAGQGGSIHVGGQFQFPNLEKFLVRATVGFKYVTTQAENAHIRLSRIPLHLTANYMATDKIRLSAGLASHQSVTFKTDGIGQDFDLKGGTGPIFEVAYGVVGLSYTIMNYQDQNNTTYSANAIGVTISGVFPKR